MRMFFRSLVVLVPCALSSLALAQDQRKSVPEPRQPTSSSSAPQRTGLHWTLPDGTIVQIASQPALDSRKMLKLHLQWNQGSPWEALRFDAEMPEHKHGMVVAAREPKLQAEPLPSYEIEGVKLHMAGLWSLKLEIRHKTSGEKRWVSIPYTLR